MSTPQVVDLSQDNPVAVFVSFLKYGIFCRLLSYNIMPKCALFCHINYYILKQFITAQ